MRSVNIDAFNVQPKSKFVTITEKTKALPIVLCSFCNKEEAKWDIDSISACSFCFIYEKLSDQREAVESLILDIEKAVAQTFERSEDRLTRVEDVDRVAVGLVMAQRFERARSFSK